MTFSADITKFIQKTKLGRDTVLRKIGLDAYTGVLKRMPVDTGRLRANTRVGLNRVNGLVNDDRSAARVEGDPPTPAELGTAQLEILKAKWGDTILITNSLNYAQYIEHGTPKMRARAPFALTFQELKEQINRIVEEVSKQL